MPRAAGSVSAAILAAAAPPCAAHAGDALWAGWNLDPWLVASLALSAGLYVRGLRALWRAAGASRGVSAGEAACFLGGWLALVVALVSPIDAIAAELFWVHMVQHEVLMLVAAPLLVLARPLAVWSWALPQGWVRALMRPARSTLLRRAWAALTAPPAAWLLHAAALWLWHVPAFFNAAVASEGWHVAQHASFFATALVFWWACIGAAAARRGSGAGVLYVFTTMVHTGALGALLGFSRTAWYANDAVGWGWTPLADQQLGGLIMWVPAGAVYLAVGLALFARWLGAARASGA
jgi:putative membrane protein